MLTKSEINKRFEENRKLLGNFPLAINLVRFRLVYDQAALAIDLAAEVDRLKAERRWITDHKPESGTHVLLLCEIRPSGNKYVCDGYYAMPKTIVSRGDPDEINNEYDEETDEYYLCEGWYEVMNNWQEYSSITIEDFVIGWMPLPQPPEGT